MRHLSSEMEATDTRSPFASGTINTPSFSSFALIASGSLHGIEIKNPASNGHDFQANFLSFFFERSASLDEHFSIMSTLFIYTL